jgi:2-aminoadipate transaminase
VRWTRPAGGMYVWITFPEGFDTGPDGKLLHAAMREGVLYVPGQFCHASEAGGPVRSTEARLCYGVATAEQIGEAIRRLRRAAEPLRRAGQSAPRQKVAAMS